MKAEFLRLNLRDFMKGLIVAVIVAVLTFCYDGAVTGTLFEQGWLKRVGMVALAALFGYLIKNLFTNSQGEILTPEKK